MGSIESAITEARSLHEAGDLEEAEHLYREFLATSPAHAEVVHFLGVICRQTGRGEEGLELIERSVALAPQSAAFWFHLGLALDEDARMEEAAKAYERAIDLMPEGARVWMNLGNVLHLLGRSDDAVSKLQKAVELAPASPEARFNLARVLEARGMPELAVEHLNKALEAEKSVRTMGWLGSLNRRFFDLKLAERIAEEAAALWPEEPETWMELGHTRAAAGKKEDAIAAYRNAQQLRPEHADAAFFLAQIEGRTPATAPVNFVTDMYDEYAEHFDEHLRNTLAYTAPERVHEETMKVLGEDGPVAPRSLRILDAGCGTGLSAPLWSAAAKELVGVDLSPNMIRQAHGRKAYDELIIGDLVETLKKWEGRFDVVLAVDVLIHLGNLSAVFAGVARALVPGGFFGFTVEAGEGDDYAMQETWRFTHTLAYLRKLAAGAGFVEKVARTEVLRQEKGKDVLGHLMVLEKSKS